MTLPAKFLATSVVLIIASTVSCAICDEDYLNNERAFYISRAGILVGLIGFFSSIMWLIWSQ